MKKEIEKDGVLTFKEAKRWYQEGDGSPITVDADKIDLNFIDVSMLTVGEPTGVQTFGKCPQGIVYGGITIVYRGNNQVQILQDEYNFEMHSWRKAPIRNVETLLGRLVHGKGTSFKINFRGVNTIHYRPLEWHQYTNSPLR